MTEIITTASASPARSLAKTVSWRVLGSLDTLLLGYIFTGSLKAAGSIASAEVVTKIILYYFHERVGPYRLGHAGAQTARGSRVSGGLSGQPGEIILRSAEDRMDDDFREFVGMELPDHRLQRAAA